MELSSIEHRAWSLLTAVEQHIVRTPPEVESAKVALRAAFAERAEAAEEAERLAGKAAGQGDSLPRSERSSSGTEGT